MYISVYNI